MQHRRCGYQRRVKNQMHCGRSYLWRRKKKPPAYLRGNGASCLLRREPENGPSSISRPCRNCDHPTRSGLSVSSSDHFVIHTCRTSIDPDRVSQTVVPCVSLTWRLPTKRKFERELPPKQFGRGFAYLLTRECSQCISVLWDNTRRKLSTA